MLNFHVALYRSTGISNVDMELNPGLVSWVTDYWTDLRRTGELCIRRTHSTKTPAVAVVFSPHFLLILGPGQPLSDPIDKTKS